MQQVTVLTTRIISSEPSTLDRPYFQDRLRKKTPTNTTFKKINSMLTVQPETTIGGKCITIILKTDLAVHPDIKRINLDVSSKIGRAEDIRRAL